MMEDRLAEEQVAVGRPGEVVQRVVRVLGAKPLSTVRRTSALPSPSVSLRNVGAVLGDVDAPSPNSNDSGMCSLSAKTVHLSALRRRRCLEDDDAVVWLLPGVGVGIRARAAYPEPAAGVEGIWIRVGDLGELLLAGEQVDVEARIDLERFLLVPGRQPFVMRAPGSSSASGDVASSSFCRGLSWARSRAAVAVGDHDVEVAHRRRKSR